jgi:hypothetical protein
MFVCRVVISHFIVVLFALAKELFALAKECGSTKEADDTQTKRVKHTTPINNGKKNPIKINVVKERSGQTVQENSGENREIVNKDEEDVNRKDGDNKIVDQQDSTTREYRQVVPPMDLEFPENLMESDEIPENLSKTTVSTIVASDVSSDASDAYDASSCHGFLIGQVFNRFF